MPPRIETRSPQQNQQLSGQQLQSIQLQAPNLGELKRGESQTYMYLCFLINSLQALSNHDASS